MNLEFSASFDEGIVDALPHYSVDRKMANHKLAKCFGIENNPLCFLAMILFPLT